MENKLIMLLQIGTYFALLPFVFRVLMGVDLSKLFKKERTAEIKMFYLFLTIMISKVIGDFINDIMNLIRVLFGL